MKCGTGTPLSDDRSTDTNKFKTLFPTAFHRSRLIEFQKCEAKMAAGCINSTLPAEVLERIFKLLPNRDRKVVVGITT